MRVQRGAATDADKRGWRKTCTFKKYARTAAVNCAAKTPHPASERDRALVIADQQFVMFTNNRLLVEQLQAFANGATTDADVAGELVGVERVHRLTEFEHHVVGAVYNRLNAADAGAAPALAHPVRRARFRIDLRADAPGVADRQSVV